MVIKLWDRTCVGFCPENCGEYHADFDGDKIQLYFLKAQSSIVECTKWNMLSRPMFDYQLIIKDMPKNEYQTPDLARIHFMNHTTMCLSELLATNTFTYAQSSSKMKQENLIMLKKKYSENIDIHNTDSVLNDFYDESIRGLNDIMRQQLTQGEVGRITRLCRVGTMDFMNSDKSCTLKTYISEACNDSVPKINCPNITIGGLPCTRLISKLTAIYQQELLDSHRAKLISIDKFNVIESLICNTLHIIVIVKRDTKLNSSWKRDYRDMSVHLVDRNCKFDQNYMLGSYSPCVLRKINKEKRFQVALMGMKFICRYYDINYNSLECKSVASMLCLASEHSKYPCTTAIGLKACKPRWVTRLLMEHWGIIEEVKNELNIELKPSTVGECCIFGNFALLPSCAQ